MSKTIANDLRERRRQLVDQVAASAYFSRSTRLREMFVYVCDRVLDHEIDEIHEQEVGRRVFGRPADYDTAADNTVRVHASMLRKRVEQYFANEGKSEPVVIEIPRGNYAPIFIERPTPPAPSEPAAAPSHPIAPQPEPAVARGVRQSWLLIPLTLLLILVSGLLVLEQRRLQSPNTSPYGATVRQFWSQLFIANRPTDVVLGDASLAFYEERTGRSVALSQYFDRSYLTNATDGASASRLDPDLAKVLLLKRAANYGDVALLAQLADLSHAEQSDTKLRFARDYTFREIKADNAILLGNIASNPWTQPFQDHQTLRWKFDAERGLYYPIDSTSASSDQEKYHTQGKSAEGYAIVSLFPNLGGTGTVLVISGTGGSAISGALGFLSDEHFMNELRRDLHPSGSASFPYFEALLRISSRNSLPRDSSILIARPVHP